MCEISGFVNETFKPTCRPEKDQRIMYNGNDRHHGFKYQGITTPDDFIPYLSGPFERARHDALTYQESGIQNFLAQKGGELGPVHRIYGDPAYTLSNVLVTPFRNKDARVKIELNTIMVSVRISVKWSFQKLFRKKIEKIDLQPVAKIQDIVSAILANIHTCLYKF